MLLQELTNNSTPFAHSFGNNVSAAVIGASGGIGSELVEALCKLPSVTRIYAFSRTKPQFSNPKIFASTIDLEKEESVAVAASRRNEICSAGLILLREIRSPKSEIGGCPRGGVVVSEMLQG